MSVYDDDERHADSVPNPMADNTKTAPAPEPGPMLPYRIAVYFDITATSPEAVVEEAWEITRIIKSRFGHEGVASDEPRLLDPSEYPE